MTLCPQNTMKSPISRREFVALTGGAMEDGILLSEPYSRYLEARPELFGLDATIAPCGAVDVTVSRSQGLKVAGSQGRKVQRNCHAHRKFCRRGVRVGVFTSRIGAPVCSSHFFQISFANNANRRSEP